MKNQKDLATVIELLSNWITRIRLSAQIDCFDIHKASEDLSAKLLNEMYDYQLENLNYEDKNIAGIDLGDKKSMIAFQVTSRTDAAKIKESLEKFVKYKYDGIYKNGLKFLILNYEEIKFGKIKYADIYAKFDKDKDIITDKDLIKDIQKIYVQDYNKFERIKSLLEFYFKDIEYVKEGMAKAKRYFEDKKYEAMLDEFMKMEAKPKTIPQQAEIAYYRGAAYYEEICIETKVEDNLEIAIRYLKESVDLIKDKTIDIYYLALDRLGLCYNKLSKIRNNAENLALAKSAYLEALKYCPKGKDCHELVSIMNALSVVYQDMAIYESPKEAEKSLEAAEFLYSRILYDNDYIPETTAGEVFNNLGRIYEKKSELGDSENNLIKAIDHYKEALKIRTLEKYPLDFALTCNNLGNSYFRLAAYRDKKENLNAAKELYEEALELYNSEKFPEDYSRIMHNLGSIYYQFYKLNNNETDSIKSINYFNEALKFRNKASFPILYASTQIGLGQLYKEIGKFKDSEENYNKSIKAYYNSLKVYTVSNYQDRHDSLCNELIRVYDKLVELENVDGIYHYKKLLSFLEEDNNLENKALVENSLAILYANNNYNIEEDFCNAIIYFNKSYDSYKILKDLFNCAINKKNLGIAYSVLYKINYNEVYLQKCKESNEEALNFFIIEEFPNEYEEINNELKSLP